MSLAYAYRYTHVYSLNQTNSTGLGYWVASYSTDGGTTFNNIDPRIPYFQSELEVKQALQNITGPASATDDSSFVAEVVAKRLGSTNTNVSFSPS